MAAGEFKVNGYDLDNFGVEIVGMGDFRTFQRRRYQVAQNMTTPGGVLLRTRPLYSVPPLTIACQMSAASLSTLDDNFEQLLAELDREDELAIELNHRASTYYYARLEDVDPGEGTGQEFGSASNPFIKFTMRFILVDPFRYAASLSTVSGIQSTPTDLPMGTAPTIRDHQWTITGAGTASDPTITLRDSTGTTRKTTSLTGSINSGDSRVLDHEAGTLVDPSPLTDKIAERDSGTDFPIMLDSHWGVFRTSAWPDIAITNTGTQMSLEVQYRKAYLR